MDEFEDDCLEFFADCLESHHRGNRVSRTRGRCDSGSSGDLLYELVRYQATQVNHLARLGLAHLDVGRRVLESWYGRGGTCSPCHTADSKLTGEYKGAKPVTHAFVVDHPKQEELTFRYDCFRDLNNGAEFNHTIDCAFAPAGSNQQLATLTIALDNEKFLKGHEFETVVRVLAKDRTVKSQLLRLKVQ